MKIHQKKNLYFITIPKIEDGINKEYVFNNFVCPITETVQRFFIAEEFHKDGTKHHHIFIEFMEKVEYDYINEIIETIYEKHGNYQSVRNSRNVITYLCKSDENPLIFNIPDKWLSFAFKAKKWVKEAITKNNNFKYSDNFVLENPQYYRLLKEVFHQEQEEQFNNLKTYELLLCENLFQLKYQNNIKNHFNNIVKNGVCKNSNLYIWGDANTFKTTTIKNIIGNTSYFRPSPDYSNFQWQEYNNENIIWIDEFDVNNINVNNFKLILDHEPWITDVKNSKPKRNIFRGIVILTSNDPPAYEIPGFCERFTVIRSSTFLEY